MHLKGTARRNRELDHHFRLPRNCGTHAKHDYSHAAAVALSTITCGGECDGASRGCWAEREVRGALIGSGIGIADHARKTSCPYSQNLQGTEHLNRPSIRLMPRTTLELSTPIARRPTLCQIKIPVGFGGSHLWVGGGSAFPSITVR